MCDPVSMLATVGTGMNVIGGIQQGKAADRQARGAAAESEYQAVAALDDARAEAANIRRAGAQQRGETLAGVAASGVKIGEGSALLAEREVMEQASRDEYMTILTGERQASAYRRQAANLRAAGRDARRAANLGAFSSLLSAGGSFAKASGWRSNGPGFSGTQAPAPVETRTPFLGYGGRY
jgi:hypothetical protein